MLKSHECYLQDIVQRRVVAKLDQSLNQTKTELDEFKRNMNSKTTQVYLRTLHCTALKCSVLC